MNQHTLPKAVWKTIVAVFLLMPLVVTVVYAFSARWVHILPEGFTLRYIAATLTNQKFLLGIGRGLLISFVPVVITNVSVLLALYVVIVCLPGLEKVVQLLCLIPTTLNGIILATSVLGTYAGTNTLLANRIVMLSFIYCVFIMPMTYQGLRNSLYAVNTRGLLEAAEMLGARRFHSFLTIVVPAILPGLCNSALMCLSGLFGDFAIIKIIASSQFETAQSYLYRNRAQDTQELSAAVVILLLITLLINYLVHKSQGRPTGYPKESAMSYITFKNICKSYDNKTQVLKGIDLEVEEGELLTLLGPSGCGKSTLLRCLAGLEQVQQGHILLEGRDITDLDARQRQIGMVFQQYSLFPQHDGGAEHGLWAEDSALKQGRDQRPYHRSAGHGGLAGQGRRLPGPAFRRPAAACGTGPRHRHPAKSFAVG